MEISVSTLVWSVINFVILLVVLRSLMFKPIMATLAKRTQSIEDSLSKADEAKKQLEQLKTDQASQLDLARAEALAMRATVAKAAEDERTRIVAEAHEESRKLMQRAKAQIDDETERAMAAVRSEIATLAIAAASRVIERSLTGADQERLVDEFLREVAN